MRFAFGTYYKNLPVPVPYLVIAALTVSVFFIVKAYTNHVINAYNFSFSWLLTGLKISISYVLWVVFTPVIYSLTKGLQDHNRQIALRIFIFLTGCLLLASGHQLIASRLDDVINYLNSGYMKSFLGTNNLVVLVIGSFSSFIELLVIVAVFFAVDYQKKYIRNQKQLIAAQLNALKMQLQPHFLFNTLHSIASMIDIDTRNAQKMLRKLGDLLRRLLEYDAEQMVTVADELKFIKDYLDLEQVRYQDRVIIHYTVAEAALAAKIPNMIFQPLVENAVKYGILPTIDNGEIIISIQLETSSVWNGKAVSLEISNTFNAQNTSVQQKSTGIGLQNIKKRLQQFYEDRFLFTSHFMTPELYVAKITLPLIQ